MLYRAQAATLPLRIQSHWTDLCTANTMFNITHVEQLLKEKVAEVAANHWQEAVRHVDTLEAKFHSLYSMH